MTKPGDPPIIFKLDEFSVETLQQAKRKWLECASSKGLPTSDYEKDFEWAEKRINYQAPNGDSLAYAIFDDATKECKAVVDIVVTKGGGAHRWLKMLTVNLRPDLLTDSSEPDPNRLEEILSIYINAALGTIQLTKIHRSNVVKLYGRSDAMLTLLASLKSYMSAMSGFALEATMEGRWLVLTGK